MGKKLIPFLFLLLVLAGCKNNHAFIVFESSPNPESPHNKNYFYRISARSSDGGKITYSVKKPSWMIFNDVGTLSGEAGWPNVNKSFDVEITAASGDIIAKQNFTLKIVLGEIRCNQNFGDPTGSPYILPFQVGKTYQLIQTYCPPNPAWGHHNWFAYDFNMSIGDTVVAMRSGRVLFVEEGFTDGNRQSGSENFVFIEHADGTVVHYMHLTKNGALVEPGQTVLQGQPIGLSGDTGNSSGPHLHVAEFRDRNRFDRQFTQPINFKNADGPLDSNNGLVQDAFYKALNY